MIVPYKSRTADTPTVFVYLFAWIMILPPRIGSGSNAIASTPPSRLDCVTLTSPPFCANSCSNNSRTNCSKSFQSSDARFVPSLMLLCLLSIKRLSFLSKVMIGVIGEMSISFAAETPLRDLKHCFGSIFLISIISNLVRSTEIERT